MFLSGVTSFRISRGNTGFWDLRRRTSTFLSHKIYTPPPWIILSTTIPAVDETTVYLLRNLESTKCDWLKRYFQIKSKPSSYPESSGSLASGWWPGETLGNCLLPQNFCGKTIQAVTGQPIKKFNFFGFSSVSHGDQLLAKEPEDSGYEIDSNCRQTKLQSSRPDKE